MGSWNNAGIAAMDNRNNIIFGILLAMGLLVAFVVLAEFGATVCFGPVSVHLQN